MSTNTFKWQLYISAYTALLGIPFLFFPESVIPLMGFDPGMAVEGPFVQLTGIFLLSLTLITFRIWQKKIAEMVLGTIVVRIFIITSLLILGSRNDFPFLFIMSAIVGVGVVGTLWSLRRVNLKQYL